MTHFVHLVEAYVKKTAENKIIFCEYHLKVMQ